MAEPNPLPWPSLNTAIAAVFGYPVKLHDNFSKTDDPSERIIIQRKLLVALHELRLSLFELPAEVSVKLDGTNVARDSRGTIYGRRQGIEETAVNYCGAPLEAVRAVDVSKVFTT